MSLVAEVLSSLKQSHGLSPANTACDGLLVEVLELSKRASDAKVAVMQSLSGQYLELSSTLQDTSMLQSKVAHVQDQLEHWQSTLGGEVQPAVSESVEAVQDVGRLWHDSVERLRLSRELLAVHQELKMATDCFNRGEVLSSAKCLNKAEKLLDNVDEEIEIVPNIENEIKMRRAEIMNLLSKIWNECFVWEEQYDAVDKFKTFTLVIKKPQMKSNKSDEESETINCNPREIFGALSMLQELKSCVNALADNIHNNFLRVLVSCSADVSVIKSCHSVSLAVKFSTSSAKRTPHPDEVFLAVNRVLNSLMEVGFGLEFEHSDRGVTTLMSLIGEKIAQSFTKLLISDCLSSAVPCNKKDLDEFDAIKAATREFHESLVKIGFYKSSEVSILDYASNIDSVFSTKSCSHLLDTARTLISQPLLNTVTITPTENYPNLVIQNRMEQEDCHQMTMEMSSLRLEKVLSAKSFHIPNCQVSKSTVQLMDIIYDTMEECCKSSAAYAGKLLCTVRNILSLYERITPVVHANTINSVPQHAALVHNNCLFLSTHCYLLGHQYRMRLPSELRDSDPSVTAFTDLGYKIQQLGTSVFCSSMQSHKKELLECLSSSQNSGEVPHETGVKRCLKMLQMLRNVWTDVLPQSVYVKAMGTLLNTVIKDIIERTLSLEDISQDAALSLTSACHLLIDNGEDLFPHTPSHLDPPPTSKVGVRAVSRWGRFQELVVVLGASLKEIENRWCDGKGPLSLHFSPDQIKCLVRALFQNTDRRAQLLARIKIH